VKITDNERCKQSVASSNLLFCYHRCSRKAVEAGFCRLHSPSYQAKKREQREAKWAQERQTSNRKWLAVNIGLTVLAKIELDGSYHIKDYAKANAKNILHHYVDNACRRKV
jgi:hypothetical protein